MTIEEFLDLLDYHGIVFEDTDIVEDRLNEFGWSLSDTIVITKDIIEGE